MATATLLVACSKEEKNPNQFKSVESQAWGGAAWTTLQTTPNGQPKELALVINDAAMNSLPTTGDGTHHGNTVLVGLPAKGYELTPFKFIRMDWNAQGHEPPGIYDIPHFDFHFYMTAPEEALNYTDDAKMNAHPAAAYFPTNYVPGPAIPTMGKHWIDVTSPELNGQPFTETFIFGSYDSKVVFYEPMITLTTLKNGDYVRSIPQPAKFGKTGYYPTKMKIKRKNGTTEVILSDFVYKTAS